MIAGLRHSAAGMNERASAQEVIANNLANVSTTGFKGDRISFAEVLQQAEPGSPGAPPALPKSPGTLPQIAGATNGLVPTPLTGAVVSRTTPAPGAPPAGGPVARQTTGLAMRTSIDLEAGPIESTGNDYDFAIDGGGFFTVQTPQGERYTRGGSFTLNGSGQLVSREGYPVLTDGGPITALNGRLMVTPDGMVSVGGEAVGRLKLVDFDKPTDLKRVAGGLFVSAGAPPKQEEDVKVAQGYVESSNVRTVDMLTQMIDTMRSFESNQKALSEQLDSIQKLVAEAGK